MRTSTKTSSFLEKKPKNEIEGISPELVGAIKEFRDYYIRADKVRVPSNKKRNFKVRIALLEHYLFPDVFEKKRLVMREIGEKCRITTNAVRLRNEAVPGEMINFLRDKSNSDNLIQEFKKVLSEDRTYNV